jgi:isonocardicin synthase
MGPIAAVAAEERLHRMPAPELAVVRLRDQMYAAAAPAGEPFGVRADALLGELLGYRLVPHYPDLRRSRAEVSVRPLAGGAAADLFARLRAREHDAEMTAPFAPTTADGEPLILEESFWAQGQDQLDATEPHVRAEVVRHLDALPRGAAVLDPACSTGACLEAIVAARPDLRATGLDRSPEMIARAARRPALADARISVHDARVPLPVQAELVVCRCLGRQVVSRADADAILDGCVAALAPGGTLLVTAFSALHHLREDLEERGLTVRQTVAYHEPLGLLFPFYRAVRPGMRG